MGIDSTLKRDTRSSRQLKFSLRGEGVPSVEHGNRNQSEALWFVPRLRRGQERELVHSWLKSSYGEGRAMREGEQQERPRHLPDVPERYPGQARLRRRSKRQLYTS